MADWYIRSGATGAATGLNWTDAFTTLNAGFSAGAAGDRFFVSEDHHETTGGVTLACPGTMSSPCVVLAVNHAGSVPPVSADLVSTPTAIVETNGGQSIFISGFVSHCWGVHFVAATGGTTGGIFGGTRNTPGHDWTFENCILELATTCGNDNSVILVGGFIVGRMRLINTQIKFQNSGQFIAFAGVSCRFEWWNTANPFPGASPSDLFDNDFGWSGNIFADIRGVDLSGFTGALGTSGTWACLVKYTDCKLPASPNFGTFSASRGGLVDVINCDNGTPNYQLARHSYSGDETTETTIVRTGGASDGTTAQSRKIVTSGNAVPGLPYEAIPILVWIDNIGSARTLTIYGIWGGGSVPNNDDIWADVEYLGSSASPIASFVSNGLADPLAAHTALASDSSTWGGSTTAFKMSVTFTPQMKGLAYVRLKAGKASSTFYIDPKVAVT